LGLYEKSRITLSATTSVEKMLLEKLKAENK
jgi:hypothetical protein